MKRRRTVGVGVKSKQQARRYALPGRDGPGRWDLLARYQVRIADGGPLMRRRAACTWTSLRLKWHCRFSPRANNDTASTSLHLWAGDAPADAPDDGFNAQRLAMLAPAVELYGVSGVWLRNRRLWMCGSVHGSGISIDVIIVSRVCAI